MISPRWLRSTEPLDLTSFEQPIVDSETIVDINSIATNTHPRVKPTDQNTKYNEMFRMLKQIGSSFALLPQEDFDDAMSRVVQLVELAQNRTKFILTPLVSNVNQSIYPELPEQLVRHEQEVQPELPDLDYVDLSDKTVLEIDNPRGRPTNATVKRRCLLKRKTQTDVPAPNPAPKKLKQTTDPNEPKQRKPRSKKN